MRIGFGKVDITPRVGVPLAGFGAFLNRVSTSIRDRLWARAMAVEHDGARAVIVGCDLLAVAAEDTARARQIVFEGTRLGPEAMLVACSHTHSGPDTIRRLIGWGGCDPPYMELLPGRIARAAIQALESLTDAELRHAEVPCEGIGVNREYDTFSPEIADALADDWRPARPELTDTICHVLKAVAPDGRLLGFASYFGCHPVVCCAQNHQIHGDYAGVATNLLEREHPGAVGLFLQGAQGDVNSCVVCKGEQESLLALDVIASRYTNAVRGGLAAAEPVSVDAVKAALDHTEFQRHPWTAEEVRHRLAEEQARVHAAADDADNEFRLAVVRMLGLRRVRDDLEAGRMPPPVEIQGIRLGPIAILASPFETFRQIKQDVVENAASPIPLVVGLANDFQGYAPDRTAFERGGYAADLVPLILGALPFARLHEELPAALLAVEERRLARDPH